MFSATSAYSTPTRSAATAAPIPNAPIKNQSKKSSFVITIEEPEFDLNQWAQAENGSIFVKRIPNWFSEDDIRQTFNCIGQISRVHIVDVSPEKGSGRMAFVHFDHWFNNQISHFVRNAIINDREYHQHTVPARNPVTGEYFNMYVTYNRRPIPRSTYDCDQLTDMINTLNAENADIREKMAVMRDNMVAQQNTIVYLLEKLGITQIPSLNEY